MKVKFIEEIEKTQSGIYTETGFKIIKNKFYYDYDKFINKHIEIIFDSKDIFSSLHYGCEHIRKTIDKTICNKMSELNKPNGLLMDYKIIDKKMSNKNITFLVQIIKCEPDCG